MIVALDRQHVGKPHRIDDLGAWGDLDGDGEHSDVIESEAIWTGIISLHAEMELRRLGHSVYPMSHGRYSQRHQDANQARVDVYVALHLNSGSGNLATVANENKATSESVTFYVAVDSKGTGGMMSRHYYTATGVTVRSNNTSTSATSGNIYVAMCFSAAATISGDVDIKVKLRGGMPL